ncbi:MAG: hypothetical protein AB1847_20065 [bacterium]
MVMEEPVRFKNRAKYELYGIAHIPSKNEVEKKVGLIFLNAGLGDRIAFNRLHVTLSRRLAQNGFYSLRFDPAGLGESEGDIEEAMLFDLYASINKGRFIHDVIDAVEFFTSKYGLEEIVLAGLCGGATTALLAAPHCGKVSSLILMGFPVLFSPLDAKKGVLDPTSAQYLLKNQLIRLINFKIPILSSWNTILGKIKNDGLFELTANLLKSWLTVFKKSHNSFHPNFNKLSLDTLERVRGSIDINFIFGECDMWKLYFEEEFEQKVGKDCENKYFYRKFIIKNANHTFTFRECHNELIDVIQYVISNKINSQLRKISYPL